ncbi:ubiquinol oxidase subunit II [Paenibacillus sp. NPDC058174]|uniref:ubiquinol oxidase subunit II n=1 Tax=Paenibacillus sp. NPDC058174 TaxID=3346366 RepID=UPI0036D764A7
MNLKPKIRLLTFALIMLMAVLLTGCSEQMIVLDPKGPIGESQKDLIYLSVILCAIVLVPVLLLTAFIIWRYRDRKDSKAAYQPNWEHSTKLETIWWGIPIIIIAILGVITVKYTYELEPSKPLVSDKAPLVIEATSLDWKWLFTYPEEGISTVNYIQIPQDRPIQFKVTADQAMNSFWIPQLGGQIYAMSGMAMTLHLQADEPGLYYGSGANFTGELFAKMTFDVKATSDEEYDAWVKEVKSNYPALTEDGFKKLTEKGASNQQFFSSFPEGLFDRVVKQYIGKGGTGHHHGGGSTEAEASKDDAKATEHQHHESADHGAVETASSEHAGH